MDIVKFEEIEKIIIEVRGQKVPLDTDVAAIYGVETKEINRAVKNNPEKFPQGYIIFLTGEEKQEVVKIFHHLRKVKFSPQLPKAFNEKGLYMLATIIKSGIATQTTIAIVEIFAKIKNLARNMKELVNVKNERRNKIYFRKAEKLLQKF